MRGATTRRAAMVLAGQTVVLKAEGRATWTAGGGWGGKGGKGKMGSSGGGVVGGGQRSSAYSDLEGVFETSDRSLMTYECTGDVLLINVHENADGGSLVFEGMRVVRSGGPA